MKQILISVLCAIVIAACNTTGENRGGTTLNQHKKLVVTYFDHFNKREFDKMAAMYTDSAEFKDPSFGPEPVMQTRAEILGKYSEMVKLIPDLKDSVVAAYPSGTNHIIVEFVSTGTPPDGKKFVLPICTIFTIEGGLISKDYTYYDNF